VEDAAVVVVAAAEVDVAERPEITALWILLLVVGAAVELGGALPFLVEDEEPDVEEQALEDVVLDVVALDVEVLAQEVEEQELQLLNHLVLKPSMLEIFHLQLMKIN